MRRIGNAVITFGKIAHSFDVYGAHWIQVYDKATYMYGDFTATILAGPVHLLNVFILEWKWNLANVSFFNATAQSKVFTARCTLVQSAVLRLLIVCLSVRP